MSDAAIVQANPATRPSTWLRVLLIVIAALEALEGMFKLPLAFDPLFYGKGWDAVPHGIGLVLSLPFALAAMFFLIKGNVRRSLYFLAGISLTRWIALLPSLVNYSYPYSMLPVLTQVQAVVFPLLMLMVVVFAYRNERLTLAGLLVGLPAITDWLGMLAFAAAVMIYGF
jgi:hypothetical protein